AELAVTVFADADAGSPPADAGRPSAESRVVVFASPGGGYTRGYYHLRRPPSPLVTLAARAAAADLAARHVLGRLRTGLLRSDLRPLSVAAAIGIGHSLGGMQLIHQQAAFQTFDAMAVLG